MNKENVFENNITNINKESPKADNINYKYVREIRNADNFENEAKLLVTMLENGRSIIICNEESFELVTDINGNKHNTSKSM